ncbi:Chromatin structure-remodeling complex subunit rsc1 [Sphaceloma murrayae]|uniref:Chromatin structure-remodeling complex subunit rsc1 n=1 Tax=Sphaceloma murrayae TaxID=2082308 RepID=A0A2K1QFM2_9PEZI|nr:Chromatin structure-remodeling complex subunit rsc1 [Sphaceloma murrayae]
MDRSRKRKADAVENGSTPIKRQKIPALTTPAEVTEAGLRLIEAMKVAKDKTGRNISTMFLTLPDKDELPDYYATIKLPLAIDDIERKLHDHEYSSLVQVESDLRRMVANAKLYNNDDSLIFADAERIRKMLFNWMKVHNPAYQDPTYVAVATPIPGEKPNGKRANGTTSATPDVEVKEEAPKPKRPTITLSRNRRTSEAQTAPAAAAKVILAAASQSLPNQFEGKSFGQVQEVIIEEFLNYHDKEGLQLYHPFGNLPSRSLTDYYQLIKKPVSLKSIAKKCRGQHGREPPTGITDFKTWDAFEEEVSFIWKNAQEYNEDGSEMFTLADDFKEHFRARLAEVKSKVEEPQSTRIKLNARPKPVLHLGAKVSQTGASSPGVTVDSEALERQKQLVRAGVNGHQTPQPPGSSSQVLSDPRQTSTPPAAVKTEKSMASPVPEPARVPSAAPEAKPSPGTSMPPPARIPSNSPYPATQPASTYVPSLAPQMATFGETFARTKPASEALLSQIHLTSHPQLNGVKPFKFDIPASPDYTQQSITIMLPQPQYYLQLSPTVSHQLSSGRQYKLFVTTNGVRASPSIRPMVNGDMTNGVERKQVYDISLLPGVNRIEVEIVAVTGRGGTLEVEKTTIFAHLMKY